MQTSVASLSKAFSNYFANEQVICTQYPDAYIILHDTQILGPFKTGLEAYCEAFTRYEIGTFIVKFCCEVNKEKEQ